MLKAWLHGHWNCTVGITKYVQFLYTGWLTKNCWKCVADSQVTSKWIFKNRPIQPNCGTVVVGGGVWSGQNVINWSPVYDVGAKNVINRRPIYEFCPPIMTVPQISWICLYYIFKKNYFHKLFNPFTPTDNFRQLKLTHCDGLQGTDPLMCWKD